VDSCKPLAVGSVMLELGLAADRLGANLTVTGKLAALGGGDSSIFFRLIFQVYQSKPYSKPPI
jgi:hypothetical protein